MIMDRDRKVWTADRRHITDTFALYVADYNAADPKIKLKIDHTYRVAELCAAIAESLKLADVDLVWLMGMLHDIGRFEQIRTYGTFSDADSVDHAMFGADLLFENGLLERFVPSAQQALSEREYRILELSIRNHSRYRLQEELTEEETLFCNILRDADKIDIFRVNYDTPLEKIYNVTTKALREAPVTEKVKQCFREQHAVLRSLKKTPVDHLVGHICLVFELVFPVSRQIVREQGNVDRLLQFESECQETRDWFAYMRENIWV